MDDLISRQAAIDAIEREQSLVERPITETRWFDLGLRKAQDVLSGLPSVQPEIIRCKDCKHRDEETGFCKGRGWPMQLVPDDGFCDKGKRSEE